MGVVPDRSLELGFREDKPKGEMEWRKEEMGKRREMEEVNNENIGE